MAQKRPLGAVAPEQAAAKRPRRTWTALAMMWLERTRARAATVVRMAQMVRQVQHNMAQLFVLVMVLVLRIESMERLLLELPNMIQRLLAQELGAFRRSIEGTVRSVLQTQIQQPQSASLPKGVHEPSSSRAISKRLPETGNSSAVVKLRFVDADRPEDPTFTRSPVKWQNGKKAKVAIFLNEKQITDGDLSKLQIEILLVHDGFFTERGQEDFTKEEFNKHIHMYEGKESVLATVHLTNGEAHLGSFIFKECSQRQKVRLAARVKRQDPANRVQEAITDPFVVKDRRSEYNAKSNRPSKGDAVHKLKKIFQKGKRCIALTDKKITTVKHLLRQYHKDKSGLQKLTGMKNEDWNTMINHATTCDPGNEIYCHRVAEGELLFNDFYDLVGMMINGFYVPVRDLDQFQQLKANNWKMSAYKKFEERENSGGLFPDYMMRNGHPEPLNNEAGPSVQAKLAWQCHNDMAAQQEFGEQHQFQQQNGFSMAEVLSNNDAGSSKQEVPLFSQHTVHQDLGQHGPSMPQNGTLCSDLTQGNILNGQRSLPAKPTIPSYNFPTVPEDDWITGASLAGQQNGYLSSWTADAPGTSCPVTDGVSHGASSLNHVEDDFSELIEQLLVEEAHGADQDFLPANNAQLPNSNNQFHGNEQATGD